MPEGSGGGKNAPTEKSGLVQMEMQFIINKQPAIEPYHFSMQNISYLQLPHLCK
jgi:hypothetical protein